MANKHMLSQVAQQTVYVSSIASGNERASSVATWKDWGNGTNKWAPEKFYQWLEDDPSYSLPNFDFSSGLQNVEWKKMVMIYKRDGYGNVVELNDPKGTIKVIKWDYNSTLPVATIANASDNETMVEICESFRSTGYGDLANNLNIYDNGNATITYSKSRDAKSGYSQRVEIDNLTQNGAGVNVNMGNLDGSVDYIIDFDYKVIEGKMEVLTYSDGAGYQWQGNFDITQGWAHGRIKWNLGGNGNNSQVWFRAPWNGTGASNVTFYLDNIRIYPEDAICTTRTYDFSTFTLIGNSNPAGTSSIFQYDAFNRLTNNLNDDKQVLTSTHYYFSRDGNGDNFNASDPNFTTTITYSSQNGYSNFASSTGWTVSGTDIQFNVTYAGKTTVRMGTDGGWDSIYKNAGIGDIISRVDFYPDDDTTGGTPHVLAFDAAGYRFCVQYLPSTDQFRIQTRFNYGSWQYPYTFNLSAPPNKWYTIEIEKTADGKCYAWVYPEGEGRDYTDMYSTGGFPTNWNANVRAWCDDDYFYLANHYVGTFSQSTTYTDGLGRTLQTHLRNGQNDIISQTSYNSIGKIEKQFKPQELSNPNHTYYANFTGSYEFFEYFNDPLARLKKQTHSDGTSINFIYGSELFNGFTYRFEQLTDETGKISKTYFDKFGNQVGGLAAVGTADQIKWVQEYDILGNLVTMKPPNYWNPPSGTVASDWITQKTYDTLGRMIEETTPDEGTQKFVYDNSGNLRYSQNAVQAPLGDFTVYYYDKHNRVTLIGEEKDDYNWTSTPPSLSNTTYGTEVNEWKIKYYYDENFVTGAQEHGQGQLTKTEINNDNDSALEYISKYVYDKFGNLVEKRLLIDGGNPISEKVVQHVYDHLGRETQLIYPSGNTIVREFDALGRLKKIYTIN